MISHQHKFIFFHVPKSGGTSVKQVLNKYCDTENAKYGHFTTDAVLKNPRYKDYFKFCFVRNPYDKLLSSFFYLKKGGKHKYDYLKEAEEMSFREFVLVYLAETPQKELPQHLQPFFYFINRESLRTIDFLGRQECLDRHFCMICDAIGLPREKLPILNQAEKKVNYRDFYDIEMVSQVARIYGEEIHHFNYLF